MCDGKISCINALNIPPLLDGYHLDLYVIDWIKLTCFLKYYASFEEVDICTAVARINI
jgi:hypothetical protein